mmetsp:Transcript_1298/g.3301  ORF Transcript_1298/g.3301 Transcript_1298/m.3301 type:complete len:369 (-) Transcript_1298:3037-4143(-)
MVLSCHVSNSGCRIQFRRRCEQWAQVQPTTLVMLAFSVQFQVLRLSNHVLHFTVPKFCHNLTELFSQQEKVVDNVLRLPGKFLSQLRVLCCNTDGACVQMTFSHHNATHSNQWGSGKTEFLRSQQACNCNIASSLELTVGLNLNTITQPIENKRLLRFGKSEFPWKTASLNSGPSSSSSTTIVSTDCDMVGESFCYTSCDNANSDFRHKLHRHFSNWLGVLQIVNELGKILNGINIVVWRWRDQTDSRGGVTVLGNIFRYFESRQFSSLTWLGTLCHLDLNLVTISKVVGCNTKSTRSNLFDTRATIILKPFWVFSTLTRVRASTKRIHCYGKCFVSLLTNGSKRHGSSSETLHDSRHRFDFFQRDRF